MYGCTHLHNERDISVISPEHVMIKTNYYTTVGNSLDKLRHTRSVAYSVELVLLNKRHISGGGA